MKTYTRSFLTVVTVASLSACAETDDLPVRTGPQTQSPSDSQSSQMTDGPIVIVPDTSAGDRIDEFYDRAGRIIAAEIVKSTF